MCDVSFTGECWRHIHTISSSLSSSSLDKYTWICFKASRKDDHLRPKSLVKLVYYSGPRGPVQRLSVEVRVVK